ncbi:MAG: hypothetical protein GY913_07185, partial [Proteobacteria bacterium]|nr:hypothetical protein [Pseudomonadota bacterium]
GSQALQLVDGSEVPVDLRLASPSDGDPPAALPDGRVARDGAVWWGVDDEGALRRLDTRRDDAAVVVAELGSAADALAVDGRGRVYVLVDGQLYDLDGRGRTLGRLERGR